jgi:dGTP triphosphohydrolase
VTEGVQGAVKAAEDTAAKAQEAAEESVAKAQAMLDQLKSAVSEKRLQDAGGLLEQLSGVTLDEEQKQTLAQLTEELKKVSGELEQGLGELKGLVVEQKYSEAMELVGKLGDYELSLEQETMFNNLKTQVQKMMESQAGQDAVKAVGNLLGR